MYRTKKAHPLVKDSKLKYANKSTPFAKHTEAIKSRESSGSSDQDYKGAEILTPTITTKDAVFKTVEPRISTPVNDKLITAIREPTSPQTESIQSRETCRLSTSIDEPQQNNVLNNPSIRRRASRASSIPISQNAKSIFIINILLVHSLK